MPGEFYSRGLRCDRRRNIPHPPHPTPRPPFCLHAFSCKTEQAETHRTSSSGGSPPRAIQAGGDEKERSMNSDEALDAVEEEGFGARKDRKTFTTNRCSGHDLDEPTVKDDVL